MRGQWPDASRRGDLRTPPSMSVYVSAGGGGGCQSKGGERERGRGGGGNFIQEEREAKTPDTDNGMENCLELREGDK